jgi:hypothetical protein
MGEIRRHSLDSTDRAAVGGERPHLTITVDAGALQAEAGGAAEFDNVGPVPAETARRLSCDASFMRVIMGPKSEPLDIGRRTPVVPAGMRRAVVIRDRHCRWAGCDRPHPWCDAHHVVPWARGGPTARDNLVLLCRAHHRLVHGGFSMELVEGRAVCRRPDGSLLEGRAPP